MTKGNIQTVSQSSKLLQPFPGLKAYGYHESVFFSGRDRQKHQLLKILGESNFVAVLGSIGVGKTSFVNCEILPELDSGFILKGLKNWKVASFRPGKDPLGAMATALSRVDVGQPIKKDKVDPNLSDKFEDILRNNKYGVIEIVEKYKLSANSNIVLFIDHLDDLIFYSDHKSEETNKKDISVFVDRLVEIINQSAYPISVITTVRTENAGHFSRFPHLAEGINKNQFLLSPLNRKDLLPIFEKITATGLISFDPEFIEHINNYYKSNPLILGNFQHAMKQCVDKWNKKGRVGGIGLSHLEASGGLDQTIGYQAGNIYGYLSKAHKATCRLIFQAVTGLTSIGDFFIIPRSIQKIAVITNRSPEEVIEVVKHFSAESCGVFMVYDAQDITGRLVQLDHILDRSDNKVSIYSEISIAQLLVLTEYPRLKKWIKEEHLNANTYMDLAEDVAKNEPLYEGEKLKATWKWYESNQFHPGWTERYNLGFNAVETFLLKSKRLSDSDLSRREAEEKSRQQKSRRNRNIKLIFSAVAIILLIVAFNESRQASMDKELAEAEKVKAESAIKQSKFDKSVAEGSLVRAQAQRQLADASQQRANDAAESAEAARISANVAKNEAILAQNKAITLQEKSNQLSSEVATKVQELERSQIIEEYLNILQVVRGKSDNANLAQTNSSTLDQRHLAAKIATAGYREFQKTGDTRFIDIVKVDSMRSELDRAKKKLFSSMNFAFQNVNTTSPLFGVGNGVIIDKNIKVTNEQGSGEFLIGANDENPTVYKVKIDNGNVTSVDVISHISNLQEGIHGIRQLSYSGTTENFLVSHLPIEQGNRNMSKYNSDGILTFSQTMPTAIKVIYPFKDEDFIVVDQNANIFHMKDTGTEAFDTVRVYSSNDHLRTIDNHNESGQIFLEKANKEIVRLVIDQDGKISETGSVDLENVFSTEITAIKYIPDREWLVAGNRNGEFYVFNALSGNLLYKDLLQHAGNINCFELSSDKKTLVSGGRDKVINIWNLDELETYMEKGSDDENLYQPSKFKEIEAIREISFVGDNYIIVVTSSEGFTGNINSGRVSLLPLDFDIMYDKLSNLVD